MDSTGSAFQTFAENIGKKIVGEDNATKEKVDETVCGALVEDSSETMTTEIKSDGSAIKAGDYVLITAAPSMPSISVKAISSNPNSTREVSYHLKIEYRRDIREDEDFFPATGAKKMKANETWSVDFSGMVRGGRATLYCDYGTAKETIVFHIRGTNSTEQMVKDYINAQNYDIWFFTRLIRQESNYVHFNKGKNYGPDWNDRAGCPSFGPPHGWGLMQLDLLDGGQRPTAQQLWNWKANVDRGYQFLNGEKKNMVKGLFKTEMRRVNDWNSKYPDDLVKGHSDQAEGLITYSHTNSDFFTFDFGRPPSGANRSFMDASWIKNYNGSSAPGGQRLFYYEIEIPVPRGKPVWTIYNLNSDKKNYVQSVSNQAQ